MTNRFEHPNEWLDDQQLIDAGLWHPDKGDYGDAHFCLQTARQDHAAALIAYAEHPTHQNREQLGYAEYQVGYAHRQLELLAKTEKAQAPIPHRGASQIHTNGARPRKPRRPRA